MIATKTKKNRELVVDTNFSAVENLKLSLKEGFYKQEGAIDTLVNCFNRYCAGMCNPDKPIANLLFLGPTGVGKTYLAELLCAKLFHSPDALLKIDCGEFQHSHEIAKLIGSPPGYLGHRETPPLLTPERLHKHRNSQNDFTIILFDEIEKADGTLFDLLLGIMDNGHVTLGSNIRVDMTKCIIIMTSNLGTSQSAQYIYETGLGFNKKKTYDKKKVESIIMESVRKKFRSEFINRIDNIVMFESFHHDDLFKILDREIVKLSSVLRKSTYLSNCRLIVDYEVKEFIVNDGYDPRYNARHLKRSLERHITNKLATLGPDQILPNTDTIFVTMIKDKINFSAYDKD